MANYFILLKCYMKTVFVNLTMQLRSEVKTNANHTKTNLNVLVILQFDKLKHAVVIVVVVIVNIISRDRLLCLRPHRAEA